MQLCGSLSSLWHCLSLGLEWKLTFSSPVATAEFSKFAGIFSAALSQHHLSGFQRAQLEFHQITEVVLWRDENLRERRELADNKGKEDNWQNGRLVFHNTARNILAQRLTSSGTLSSPGENSFAIHTKAQVRAIGNTGKESFSSIRKEAKFYSSSHPPPTS